MMQKYCDLSKLALFETEIPVIYSVYHASDQV